MEFKNSRKITSVKKPIKKASIKKVYSMIDIMEDNLKKLKTKIKKSKEENCKTVIERLTTEMNDNGKRLLDISTLTGVSNWLTVLPITEFEFELSKQQFLDSIRL